MSETLTETKPESLPSSEASEELMLPPVLYHTAPIDRHRSIAEHGIIPRDDPRNPGGVSGVGKSGDYEFPGRNYLSVIPLTQRRGENVIYAVDTSVLDPSLFQVDEDNYPLGAGNRKKHKPELDTPENINKGLRGDLQPSESGVAGFQQTVAYQGIIPPEALAPVDAYVENGGSRRMIDVPKMIFESKKFREFLDKEKQRREKEELEKARQRETTRQTTYLV